MSTLQMKLCRTRNWAGLGWMLALPVTVVATVIAWSDAPHAGVSGIPFTLLSSLALVSLLTVGVHRSVSNARIKAVAQHSADEKRKSHGVTRRHFWAGYALALLTSLIAGAIGAFTGATGFLTGITGSGLTNQAPAQLFTALALLSIPLALVLLAPLSLVTILRQWTPGKAAWRHLIIASLAIGIGAALLSTAQASVTSAASATSTPTSTSVSTSAVTENLQTGSS